MKKFFLTGLLISATFFLLITGCKPSEKIKSGAITGTDVINISEVERIEKTLASDEMRGRKTFTPDIDNAANFITAEFQKIGLQKENNNESYKQEFSIVHTKFISATVFLDSTIIEPDKVITITSQPQLMINQDSGYEIAFIKQGANLQAEARKYIYGNKNMLVLVDNSFASRFGSLSRFKSLLFKSNTNIVFILSDVNPFKWSVESIQDVTLQKMANVIGILPGKSKKEEFVIFSGHYDHLGIGKPVDGDSIYNGANDDAAGTTAVIMLAKYFKQLFFIYEHSRTYPQKKEQRKSF